MTDKHIWRKCQVYQDFIKHSIIFVRFSFFLSPRYGLKTEELNFDSKTNNSKESRTSRSHRWREKHLHPLFNKFKIYQRHLAKLPLRHNRWITSPSVPPLGRTNTIFRDCPTCRDTTIIRNISTVVWMLFRELIFQPHNLILIRTTNSIFLIWQTVAQCQATWQEID